MGKILGIDLGTTNSVMAVWDGREPRILVNEEGARLTPSVVAFGETDEVLVGHVARRQAVTNAHSTISSVKRFIGQRFEDVRGDCALAPYKVVSADDGDAAILVGNDRRSPAQISAHILRALKKSAEIYLGERVEGAVITVPAYFNDAQRSATKEAGRLAGLDVRRIINEPTAAALAYGLDKNREQVVAVYDFGGGTFDVSVLTVDNDVIEVISTHGDTHLGGDDIDAKIVEWLLEQFCEQTGKDIGALAEDFVAKQRLREAAELAKIELSSRNETEVNLPFLTAGESSPHHLRALLSRSVLEMLVSDLVERTLDSCRQALEDAGKGTDEIDEIVLVGGSSRIPLVQRSVAKFFGKEPRRTVNPDEVVALGAAVQAGVLSGEIKGLVLLDVTSLSLGVETYDGRTAVLIPRNTTIPTDATRTFSTATDGQTSVEVHVLQGESESARENDSLGRFELDGIRQAPAGTPQIDVTFRIDLNGMVQVSAYDRASGRSQTVSVTARTAPSQTEQHPALRGGHEAHASAGSPPPQRQPQQQPPPSGPAAKQPGVGLPAAVQEAIDEGERVIKHLSDQLPTIHRGLLGERLKEIHALVAATAPVQELERARAELQSAIKGAKAALDRRAH